MTCSISQPSPTRSTLLLLVGIALTAPFCLPQKATAQRIFDGPALSFSNFELGYERRGFDSSLLDDANGFHAGLSIAPIPVLYFAGDFRYASSEEFFSGEDVDFIDARAGVGLRLTLLGTLTGYLEGGAVYGELNSPTPGSGYKGTGFYVEPGLKLGLFGWVEASVAGDMAVIDGETIFGGKAGLMFGITDHLGLTLDAGISEHTDYLGIGLRIAW